MTAAPDLAADLLAVLRRRSVCMTYYLANALKARPMEGETHVPRPGLTTAEVRRELLRLEKAGAVKRVPWAYSPYRRQICWAIA